jgi:Mn2+/Fe2+ NRAMP family transporter
MFFVCAAVTAVTAGFFDNLFGITELLGLSVSQTSAVLLLSCALILFQGRYSALDFMIKVIASVLFFTTVVAFVLALLHGPVSMDINTQTLIPSTTIEMAFLIALMGWMPTAVDLSAWNSLWTVERIKQSGYKPTLRETLLEFNIGYVISGILAIMFLVLGTYLFNGSDMELSSSGPAFANQVVSMFTETIGSWSYAIVAASSFAIMLGTCIAVLDGYARAMERCVLLLKKRAMDKGAQSSSDKGAYSWTLSILAIGALIIIWFLGSSMPKLVDIATTISFLVAPVIAGMNYYLVKSSDMGSSHKLPRWLNLLAILGLVYLTLFSVLFLVY